MATAYTHASYSSDTAVSKHGGNTITRSREYEVATALVINDTIKLFKVPNRAKMVDLVFGCDDLDTGSTITLTARVSDGSTTANAFVASDVGQAGGIARMDTMAFTELVTDSDDFYLEILVAAAPTGGGTGTITCSLTYTMDLDSGE